MSKGGKVTDLSSSAFLANFGARVKNTITGIQQAWFGPLDPLVPLAPDTVRGRQFDYQVGYNINVPPRPYEPGMFADLRNLAQNCDVLRLVIETRKDQLEALPWAIAPKVNDKMEDNVNSAKIKEITDFLQYPDKENDWSQWLRMILEDSLVLDAVAVYRRPNKKGGLYSLDIIDATTIARKINADGRMPMSPEPAYQQVLKGIPAVDYTAQELLYLRRNPRSFTPYGFSPVEQIIITVNTQIRRMLEQLAYFTSGNIPLGFGTLPKEYTPQQIVDFATSFNAMREGNQEQRSQLVFMPDGFKYAPVKEAPLKSDLDEWLARKICFAFSVSPEPFVTKVNRATAETSKDTAEKEGIIPTQHWFKRFMDRIILEDFQAPDLEFVWLDDKENDALEASTINIGYVKAGVRSIDEVRADLGDEILGGAFSQPMLATNTGYIPVGYMPPVPGDATDGENGADNTHDNSHDASTTEDKVKNTKAEAAKKLAYANLVKRGKRKPPPFTAPQPVKGVRL